MHARDLRLRNTLRLCNNSFFLAVAMVPGTRLGVTLYQHCLSYLCRSNRLFICRKSKGIVKSIDNTVIIHFTPWQVPAQGGGEGLAPTIRNSGAGCQHHALADLPPGETRYPLYGRLGGPPCRFGWARKISPPLGFDPQIVRPVVFRCAGHHIHQSAYVMWSS